MFPRTVVVIPVTKIKVSFLSLGQLLVSGKMVEEIMHMSESNPLRSPHAKKGTMTLLTPVN